MPRPSSNDHQESITHDLRLKIIRLQRLNARFHEEKEREYKRLTKSNKSRNVFFAITALVIFFFLYNLKEMEEKDKSLLKTSYEEMIQVI